MNSLKNALNWGPFGWAGKGLAKLRRRHPTVAVLRLSGTIGAGQRGRSLSLEDLAGDIERAFDMSHIEAVALVINSPGGSPVQSALIGKRIRDLAEEKNLRVYAFVEDVAASGGYWLATVADEIYADRSSVIGSIGVISAGFGFQDAIAKVGIERRVHTAGISKSTLDPFEPEKAKDVKRLKGLLEDIHEAFMDQVRSRRGSKLKAEEKELFNGEFWTGAKALDLGLIDGLGDLRGELRRRYGEKLRLKLVNQPRSSLRRMLGFGGQIAGPSASLPTLTGQDLADGLLSAAEERALWARYGL
ncbi:S49 family peptidase [Rhodovibrionaceae bacterium A322]